MSDESDITKKIKETKLQTNQLKDQLQNLIDEGKNLICPSHSKHSIISNNDEQDEKPLDSPNKVQILKSYDNEHSNIYKVDTRNIPKTEVKQISPKKGKSYDVKDAREYMKKQKEKRLEQKQNQNQQKIRAEMQKKKLDELNKKSRELLAKNVQAKMERSKSRDRSNFMRPDEATSFGTNLRKAISVDRKPHLQ